jgi:hypothetical protein
MKATMAISVRCDSAPILAFGLNLRLALMKVPVSLLGKPRDVRGHPPNLWQAWNASTVHLEPRTRAALVGSAGRVPPPRVRGRKPSIDDPWAYISFGGWHEWRDSNPQPPVLETGALAIELHSCGRDDPTGSAAAGFMPEAGTRCKLAVVTGCEKPGGPATPALSRPPAPARCDGASRRFRRSGRGCAARLSGRS